MSGSESSSDRLPVELALSFGSVARAYEAFRLAHLPEVADDCVRSSEQLKPQGQMRWPGTELLRSTLFADVRQVIDTRSVMVTADWYVGHLGTRSALLQLPEPTRSSVLTRIRAVLPSQVELAGDLGLHLARRT